MREHGTYVKYKIDGCRCNPCGWARYQYDDRRKKLTAQGRWEPYVDPSSARAHLELLRAAGLGLRQIAAAAGLNRKALMGLADGSVEKIRPETRAALLAVTPAASKPDKAVVDATGTRRRVQALAALGWALTDQAEALGWLLSNYVRLARTATVTAATERDVSALYDRWSMRPPPDSVRSRRARGHARKSGWFPPLAWDDEAIDDPAATPVLLAPLMAVDLDLELLVQHLAAGHDVMPTAAARREIARRTFGLPGAEVARLARCSTAHVTNLRSEVSAA